MQWTDEGIVLGARRHGETSGDPRIDDARHMAAISDMVRGGVSARRLKPDLAAWQ
jgi:hypothetical protein